MSESDIERLGDRHVKDLKIPGYFLEGSDSRPARFSSKEFEPDLQENTARLHSLVKGTKLSTVTFADGLVLPEENSSEDFTLTNEESRGLLYFHFHSLEWQAGKPRLENPKSFQVNVGALKEWGVKPGVYFAQRNADLRTDLKCEYHDPCHSRENGICKRGGCWYRTGHYDDKENVWHAVVDFNRPMPIV